MIAGSNAQQAEQSGNQKGSLFSAQKWNEPKRSGAEIRESRLYR